VGWARNPCSLRRVSSALVHDTTTSSVERTASGLWTCPVKGAAVVLVKVGYVGAVHM